MNYRNGQIIFVIGVSGVGKTTIGKRLAERLELPYREADDFHPPENVAKMSQGIPLTDEDRLPWLKALNEEAISLSQKSGAVLTSSALKASYRTLLSNGLSSPLWIYLTGDTDIIKRRITLRKGHYMPPELLQSQLDTMEEPKEALKVNIDGTPEEIIETIITQLNEQ